MLLIKAILARIHTLSRSFPKMRTSCSAIIVTLVTIVDFGALFPKITSSAKSSVYTVPLITLALSQTHQVSLHRQQTGMSMASFCQATQDTMDGSTLPFQATLPSSCLCLPHHFLSLLQSSLAKENRQWECCGLSHHLVARLCRS